MVKTTLKLINTEGEVKWTNEISITGALALAPKVGTFNFYVLLVSTVLGSGKNNCMWYRGVPFLSLQVASSCSLISC